MKTHTADPVASAPPPATLPDGSWIVFFGEDWGGHNSTGQYLAAGLAERHRVLWVDSLGLRSPRLNRADLRRIVRKLRTFLRNLSPRGNAGNGRSAALPNVPDNIVVVSPLAAPWLRYGWVRRVNRLVVGACLRRAARREGIDGPFVITACPAAVDVLDVLHPRRTIYYCADEHAVFPGMDPALVGRIEGELIARVDRVIATSRALVRRKSQQHRDVRYLPHGVNWAHMHSALTASRSLAAIPGAGPPVAGFIGQISDHVDLGLLAAVAASLPFVRFVIVGPVVEPAPALPRAENIRYVGPQPYAELPHWLAGFGVALMPFADTPRVRYAHPTKVREYLAAGCPVVATPHPELEGLSPFVTTAATALEFAAAIRRALAEPPDREAISRSVVNDDWSARALELEAMVAAA
jgi:glycosyltransferase involved in cell wall biosynthesis